MAFRMGNGNRRNDNRGFDRSYGGGMNRQMNPWAGDNSMNFRGGGDGGVSNDVIQLANNLVSNILRQQPPSLLDLPQRMNFSRDGDFGGRYDDRRMGNRNSNRRNGPGGGRFNNAKLGVKGGIRKPNAQDRSKKVLAKNTTSAKPGQDSKNTESGRREKRESKYADVPNDMFYCHLCKKHMWDAVSFENHVKGRAHLMMREGVEESYRLKANMIRQEAKLDEQLKTIELERLRRLGKNNKANTRRDYCTMCDLQFLGHMSIHRRNEGHLSLKRFLHPKCSDCVLEFATRIEYDLHLLSPEHMKKVFATKSYLVQRRKNQLVISTEEDELKDVREEKKKVIVPKKEKKEGDAEGGEDDAKNGEGAAAADGENGKEDEKIDEEGDEAEGAEGEAAAPEDGKVEADVEAEDIILDFVDGDEVPIEIDTKIPLYNHTRSIASSMIHKLDCYECYLCTKYFDTERTSEIHTRTVTHHKNFVKFLNEKSNDTKIAKRRAVAVAEEAERKKKKAEAAAAAETAAASGNSEDVEMKTEPTDDTYDPSEATGDDEDKQGGDTEEGDETIESADITTESIKVEPETEVEMKPVEPEPEAKPVAPAPAPAPVEEVKPKPVAPATPSRGSRNRGRGRYRY